MIRNSELTCNHSRKENGFSFLRNVACHRQSIKSPTANTSTAKQFTRKNRSLNLIALQAIGFIAISFSYLTSSAAQGLGLPPSCMAGLSGTELTPACRQGILRLKKDQKAAIVRDELIHFRRSLSADIADLLRSDLPDKEARGLEAALILRQAEDGDTAIASTIERALQEAETANDQAAIAYLLTAQAKIAAATQNWALVGPTLEQAATRANDATLPGLLSEIGYARGEHALREKDFAGAEPWLLQAYEGFMNAGRKDRAGETCQLLTGAYAYNMQNTSETLQTRAGDEKAIDHPCRVAALFYRGQRLDMPFEQMEPLAKRALTSIEKNELATMAPGLLNSTGMAAGRGGDYGQAIRYYEQAREGFESVGNQFMAAATAANQAKLLSEIGASNEAIPIFEESIGVFQAEAPDRFDLVMRAERQIGLAHEREGRMDEAAVWLERAYQSSRSYTIRYYDGLVGADYARALYAVGQEQEALSMAEDAVETVLATEDAADIATAWRTLSWLGSRYLERGDVEKANAFLNRASTLVDPDGQGAEALYNGPGVLYTRLEYAWGMAELLKTMDEPSRAIDYALVALKLSENRLKDEKIRSVANINLQRDLAEKEVRLASVEQTAALAQLTVRNTRLRMLVSTGFALAASLAAFVMFRFYRTQKQVAHIKDTFLAEIHHRVGNNLQLITSLIKMEAKNEEENNLGVANRIRTMSLIHSHIYQHGQDTTLDGPAFLQELAELLEQALGNDSIYVTVDADPVSLDISAVTPIGLVVSEAVTNAYKYAFTNKEAGNIHICLQDCGAKLLLEIRDNGGGAGSGDIKPSQGSRLMQDLATQLGGIYVFENTPKGVAVQVEGIPKGMH